MTYRYTEKELADIQKRQAVNLANFQRNSGRGLPAETLKEMEQGQGVKLDSDGAPVPKKVRPKRKAPAIANPKPPALGALEQDVARELGKGKHPLTTRRPAHSNMAAPAIARHRKRAECDGILFDSQLEMRRYKELKLLKAAGDILYFLRQVPFHLPGGIVARVDFMVTYRQRGGPPDLSFNVFEDCKAAPNGRSKGRFNDHDRVGVNKRKQIKALYGVSVKLVHKARA
jgi:hypothetical protein